jgi:tRNA nucleotidyltransferase (CCA-adding enzyme)
MKGPSSRRFSLPQDVMGIIKMLRAHGFLGYVVGGAVRDLLLGTAVSDWDLATDAVPDRLVGIFPKVVPTGVQHGTVMVLLGPAQYEITTFRTDGDYASLHRLRKSSVSRTIEEDLRHRDFTINAMAYDPVAEILLDPFGGRRDLEMGIIRAVEDPLSRFMEDGLRPYRAIRFAVTLGARIERRTLRAIGYALDKVRTTSWERVRDEILKVLAAKNPSSAFEIMRRTGLLAIALPEVLEGYQQKHDSLGDLYHHLLTTVDLAPPRPLLRLACLLHDVGEAKAGKRLQRGDLGHGRASVQMADAVAKRLRLSNKQKKYIHRLIESHEQLRQDVVQGQTLRRVLAQIDRPLLDDLFLLSIADRKASGADSSEIRRIKGLRKRAEHILRAGAPLTVSQLAIKGDTVQRILGITEGVEVGRILGQLLDVVLENPEKNNPRDLAALVKKIGQT